MDSSVTRLPLVPRFFATGVGVWRSELEAVDELKNGEESVEEDETGDSVEREVLLGTAEAGRR